MIGESAVVAVDVTKAVITVAVHRNELLTGEDRELRRLIAIEFVLIVADHATAEGTYVALTRARRRLHVYVPVRYYHRPRGGDDAHGYGRASRFLTDDVQSLFTRTRPADSSHMPPVEVTARRIEVSVDALFS